jgi:CelD/BcsL family acetyltransferase involved in cellulose biosynthesis
VATASRPASGAALELPLDDARWRTYASRHPEALAFHRPEWAELLADCYGYRPFVLARLGPDGRIDAGLPVVETTTLKRRRWVALPFSDSCPPLLETGVEGASFSMALDEARREAGVGSFEIRSSLAAAGSHAHRLSVAVLHDAKLQRDAVAVFARLHPSQVQRNIRRAERERVVVRRAETKTDLTRSFFRLQVMTRHRLGMPAQPRKFFEQLWAHMLEPDYGFLLLAYSGREPIAGAVFLDGTTTLTYKYGASDPAFWRLRPNHLLLWNAMRRACEHGYRCFDLGRTDLQDRGLRDFKSGWAASEKPLVYTTLAARAPRHDTGRALAATRALLRRSPEWVCRASGELLYRHAA